MTKKIIIYQIFLFALLLFAPYSKAAYPISEKSKNNNSHTLQIQMPGYGGNPHNEDKGIFGILALIFAVTGLFPFAIACGIIGTQNGRKFKGIAKAGLLFGILVGFVFVCYLFYRLVII